MNLMKKKNLLKMRSLKESDSLKAGREVNMLWQNMSKLGGDYRFIKLAHTMLNDDEGLSEKQFEELWEFVYWMIGESEELKDLFNHVEATDGRYYVKESVSRAS